MTLVYPITGSGRLLLQVVGFLLFFFRDTSSLQILENCKLPNDHWFNKNATSQPHRFIVAILQASLDRAGTQPKRLTITNGIFKGFFFGRRISKFLRIHVEVVDFYAASYHTLKVLPGPKGISNNLTGLLKIVTPVKVSVRSTHRPLSTDKNLNVLYSRCISARFESYGYLDHKTQNPKFSSDA